MDDDFGGIFADVSPVSSDGEEDEESVKKDNGLDVKKMIECGILEKADAGMRIPLCDQFRKIPVHEVIDKRREGLGKHAKDTEEGRKLDAQAEVLYNNKELLLPVLQEINAGLGEVTNLASFMETYKKIAIEQMRKIENVKLIPFGRDLYIMAGMMAGVLRADEEHRIHFKKVARFEMHNFHKEAETFLINEQTMEMDRRATEKRKASDDEYALRKMMDEEEERRDDEEREAQEEADRATIIELGLFDNVKYYRLLHEGLSEDEARIQCEEEARKFRLALDELAEPISSPPRSEMGDTEIDLDMERIRLDDELNNHAPVMEPFTLARCLELVHLSRGDRHEDYDDRMEVDENDEAQQRRHDESPHAPWLYTGMEERQYVPPNQGAMSATDSRRDEHSRQQQIVPPHEGDAVAAAPVEARREVKQEPQWEEGAGDSSEQRVPETAPGIKGEPVDEAEEERLREVALRAKERREREEGEEKRKREREEQERRDREKREKQKRLKEKRNASPQPVPPPVLPPQPVPPPVLPPPSRHRRPASPSPAARAAKTAAAPSTRPPAASSAASPPAPSIAPVSHADGPPQPVLPPTARPRRAASRSPAARAAAAPRTAAERAIASGAATRRPAASSAAASSAAAAPAATTRPTDPRPSRSRTRSVTMEVDEEEEMRSSSPAKNTRSATRARSRSPFPADRGRAEVLPELSDDTEVDDLAPVYIEKYKQPLDFGTLKAMVEQREERERMKMMTRMPKRIEEANSSDGASKDWVELSSQKELQAAYERPPRVDYGVRPAPGTLKSAMKHPKPGQPVLLTDMAADKLRIHPGDAKAVKKREELVNLQRAIAMQKPEEKKKRVQFCAAEDPRNKMRLYCMSYTTSLVQMREDGLVFDPLDNGYDAYIYDKPLTFMKELLQKTEQMNKEKPCGITSRLSTLPYRFTAGSCTQMQPRIKDKFLAFRKAPVAMPLGKGNDVIFTRASSRMTRADAKKEQYTEYDVPHRDYKIIRAIKPMRDDEMQHSWLPQLRLYVSEAFGCGLSRQLGKLSVANSGLSHLVFTDSLLDRVNTFRFPQTYFAIHQQPFNLSSSFRVLCNEIPLEALMKIDWFIFAYGFDEMLFQQQHPRFVAERLMHHVLALEKLYFAAADLLRTRLREPLNVARFRVFKLPLIGMDDKLKPWIKKFNAQLENFAAYFKSKAVECGREALLPMHFQILEWETEAIVKETNELGEEEARETMMEKYRYNCIDSFARAALAHCAMRTARKVRDEDREVFNVKRKAVDAPGLSKEDHDRIY